MIDRGDSMGPTAAIAPPVSVRRQTTAAGPDCRRSHRVPARSGQGCGRESDRTLDPWLITRDQTAAPLGTTRPAE